MSQPRTSSDRINDDHCGWPCYCLAFFSFIRRLKSVWTGIPVKCTTGKEGQGKRKKIVKQGRSSSRTANPHHRLWHLEKKQWAINYVNTRSNFWVSELVFRFTFYTLQDGQLTDRATKERVDSTRISSNPRFVAIHKETTVSAAGDNQTASPTLCGSGQRIDSLIQLIN